MPVLGGSSAPVSVAAGINKPGVWIPAGSLDRWRPARDGSSAELAEVSIFGDSTTYGSANGTPQYYSWVQRLRARSRAAGYLDGGRGIVGINDFPTLTTGGPSVEDGTLITASLGGWGARGGPLNSDTFGSDTPGQALTVQGWGTRCRLTYVKTQTQGAFSVSVDGGAATSHNAYVPLPAGNTSNYWTTGSILLELGGYGKHTVTVTNLGGPQGNIVELTPEFINHTGIVYHRNAVSGNAFQTWFGKGNWHYNLLSFVTPALGVIPDTPVNNFAVGNAEAPHPLFRKTRLAICALGINNQQGIADNPAGIPAELDRIREGLHVFALLARNGGADPLVVVPHYDFSAGADYGGAFREAHVGTARALHMPIVDFNIGLGPVSLFGSKGYVGNVHANKAVYDAEADFLWDEVLSL